MTREHTLDMDCESDLWTGDAELPLTDVRLSALFEVPVVRLPLPHSKGGSCTLVAVIEPHSQAIYGDHDFLGQALGSA